MASRHRMPIAAIAGATLLVVALCGQAITDDRTDRVSVSASGSASTRPDVVELRVSVMGNAKLAADALKKFQANRRRAVEAMDKLKLAGLTIEGNGPTISSVSPNQEAETVMRVNGNAVRTEPGLAVAESLVIRLPLPEGLKREAALATVITMVDAATDCGLTLTRPIQFRSSRIAEARSAAVRAAMTNTRKKAEELAGLAHAKLGRLISVRQEPTGVAKRTDPLSSYYAMFMAANGMSPADSNEEATTELAPIEVTVVIEAEFAIEGGK